MPTGCAGVLVTSLVLVLNEMVLVLDGRDRQVQFELKFELKLKLKFECNEMGAANARGRGWSPHASSANEKTVDALRHQPLVSFFVRLSSLRCLGAGLSYRVRTCGGLVTT